MLQLHEGESVKSYFGSFKISTVFQYICNNEFNKNKPKTITNTTPLLSLL